MNKKTLGQFIAELRKEKNLTQRQLAEMLNVSDKTISHWERDESSPDISLLPILADIFSISVDELLRGEIKETSPPLSSTFISSQSENSMKENTPTEKSPKKSQETIESRFRRYKLLSLIGTGFGVFALFQLVFQTIFMLSAFYGAVSSVTVTFPLLSTGKYIVISIVATVLARLFFSSVFIPHEENEESVYILKANRIFIMNIYFAIFTLFVGFVPFVSNLIGLPILTAAIAVPVFLAVIIIPELLLRKNGFLKRTNNKKLIRLRITSLIIAFIFITGGVGVHIFCESYSPTVETLTFTDLEEFREYIETPNSKPEDAYRIDGVGLTILHSTGQITPSESRGLQTLYDNNGNKILTFEWLNGEVHNFIHEYTIGNSTKITVTTYKEDLKPVYWKEFQGKVIMFMFVYYPTVILVSSLLYFKKSKKLKNALSKSE